MRFKEKILAVPAFTYAAALLAAFCLNSTAMAETWRLATKVTPQSPEGQVHQKFADLVSEYTNGDLTVKIFPSEQLGDPQSVLEQVSAGVIDIFVDDVTYLEKWNSDITWVGAPFIFDDRDHWTCFLKSDYFGGLVETVAAEANVTTIGYVGPLIRGPYRVILSTDPINGLDDVANLKLRIWDNQLMVDVWTAMGAEVRVLGWTDVYQAIQTGIVESVTAPAALVESMKFNEVAPHIRRTDEFNQASAYMINTESLNKLTDAQKAGVMRAYEEAGAFSAQLMGSIASDSFERMVANGATYDKLDTAPFIARAREIYQDLALNGKIPAGFLEAVDTARKSCG